MIYFEGLESIIECIYLEDSISSRPNTCDIFVNPENITYMMGRTVIINSCEYPEDNIRTLVNNRCRVISRVYFGVPGIEVRPYILKLNDRIIWKVDDYGNLSCLGWVLQQVGINVKTDTPFVNLDVIKTQKYIP